VADDQPHWIVIPNWDRFQHYKDRRPTWIKLYPELLDDPAYLSLGIGARLLLIELWMMYANSGGQVTDSTATLTRRRNARTLREQLDALNHAGFIQLVASKPLAQRREEKKEKGPRAKAVVHTLPLIVRPLQ
jgi:hypothetical protein